VKHTDYSLYMYMENGRLTSSPKEKIQHDFEGTKPNKHDYVCISAQLATLDINHIR